MQHASAGNSKYSVAARCLHTYNKLLRVNTMALVKCKECRTLVSSMAKVCPSCGVKKPSQTPTLKKTRTSIVLGGVIFIAVVSQFMKPNKAPQSQPQAQSQQKPKECSTSPFEAFETGKIYVSGELSSIVDKTCPTSSWSPDQTIIVYWKSQAYQLTTVKLPFDGIEAKYKLTSVEQFNP